MADNNPELVSELDGKTYVLTATRCYVTWRVLRGGRDVTDRKRFRRGEEVVGVPEANLAKLVDLGHAVPKDEYDPEQLEQEKLRKRLMYDQNAASSAMLEFTMARNRAAAAAGQKTVGLPDAPAKTTDSGYEVDGIKVEDVSGSEGSAQDDQSLTTETPEGDKGQGPANYREMDYPTLQQYGKQVTGSGAGSKDEIIARLDEHFNTQQ